MLEKTATNVRPILPKPGAWRLAWLAFWPLLVAGTLIWAAGSTGAQVPSQFSFPHLDKVAHFFVYGLLATLVFRIFAHWPRQGRAMLAAILLTSAFGALDELRQSFNPHRQYETADWVADTLGAVTAVLVYWFWPLYRNLLEYRVFPLHFNCDGKHR